MNQIEPGGTTNLRLTEHLEAVLTDELQKLAVGQAEELLHLGDLGTEKRTSSEHPVT